MASGARGWERATTSGCTGSGDTSLTGHFAASNVELAEKRVLDIGSGTGFYIDLWKRAGAKLVEGADITEVVVRTLSEEHSACHFHQLDIGAPLPDALDTSYDFISAMDVLFHIVDDDKYERAIHNVADLLVPGGFFIWSDNFVGAPGKRSKHIVHRPLQETRAILNNAGFSIVSRRPTFVLMSQPVDEASFIRRKLWSYIVRLVSGSERRGMLIGGLLYPIELMLLSVVNETPATEIMVCRKAC